MDITSSSSFGFCYGHSSSPSHHAHRASRSLTTNVRAAASRLSTNSGAASSLVALCSTTAALIHPAPSRVHRVLRNAHDCRRSLREAVFCRFHLSWRRSRANVKPSVLFQGHPIYQACLLELGKTQNEVKLCFRPAPCKVHRVLMKCASLSTFIARSCAFAAST